MTKIVWHKDYFELKAIEEKEMFFACPLSV
jgi:hypothetical protein